jgi:glycosyltransferase involved in cell wall biosynthesis|tara:strand:+ start:1970 stop:2629 length:660 start_codon:yes stop_codon:yes gene_type:complete
MKNLVMKNLQISVIVPVFNREKFIGRCLRSLLSQSFGLNNFEIILVDDGSTDSTEKIYKTFSNDVTIIKLKKNYGLPTALNEGIKNAKGRFIVRVDSDDYVNSEFLQVLYLFISENSEIDAVACDYLLVDDKEQTIKRFDCLKKPIGCGIMFKTEHLVEIGLYNEKFLLHEEKELRSRFEKKYTVTRVSLALYRYRKHDSNMTNDKKRYRTKLKMLNKR